MCVYVFSLSLSFSLSLFHSLSLFFSSSNMHVLPKRNKNFGTLIAFPLMQELETKSIVHSVGAKTSLSLSLTSCLFFPFDLELHKKGPLSLNNKKKYRTTSHDAHIDFFSLRFAVYFRGSKKIDLCSIRWLFPRLLLLLLLPCSPGCTYETADENALADDDGKSLNGFHFFLSLPLQIPRFKGNKKRRSHCPLASSFFPSREWTNVDTKGISRDDFQSSTVSGDGKNELSLLVIIKSFQRPMGC